MKRVAPFLIAVLAVLLSACTTISIQPALDRPPLVEPLEVTIGKCFGPAISNYEYRETGEGKMPWVFALGPPSVAMFDLVFTGMFVKTMPVKHCPPKPDQVRGLDAVIETRIERFWWYDSQAVRITYRFLLYSPGAETIHSWAVAGEGLPASVKSPFIQFPAVQTRLSESVKLAMRDAAAKFVTGFRNQPKIRAWLQGLNISSGERQ